MPKTCMLTQSHSRYHCFTNMTALHLGLNPLARSVVVSHVYVRLCCGAMTHTCEDTHAVRRDFPGISAGIPTVSTTRPSASWRRSFRVPSVATTLSWCCLLRPVVIPADTKSSRNCFGTCMAILCHVCLPTLVNISCLGELIHVELGMNVVYIQ